MQNSFLLEPQSSPLQISCAKALAKSLAFPFCSHCAPVLLVLFGMEWSVVGASAQARKDV